MKDFSVIHWSNLMVFSLILLIPLCVSLRVYDDRYDEWFHDEWRLLRKELHDRNDERNDVDIQFDAMDEENATPLPHLQDHNIHMPNVAPTQNDTYLCVAFEVPSDDRYIVEYQPAAKMQIAHHMIMFACEVPLSKEGYWDCRDMGYPCKDGKASIVYAWGRNAPSLKMPKDVGFHVGGSSGYKYLVLQVHYLDVSSFKDGITDVSGVTVTLDNQKKKYLAGIFDLLTNEFIIPAHRRKVHVDTGCRYAYGPTITPFRFRVHAHSLGAVITAYRVRNNKWTLIGRGDPQRPQAFYKSAHITIRAGDTLMGRCTYNSEKRNRVTRFGPTHKDEMCNFYIMYYYDPRFGKGSAKETSCRDPDPKLFYSFPESSDKTLTEMMYTSRRDGGVSRLMDYIYNIYDVN